MAKIFTAQTCFDYSEALVLSSYLDAYGVVNFIPDNFLVGNSWYMTPALFGVRIWIMDNSAEDAAILLQPDDEQERPVEDKGRSKGLVHSYITGWEMVIFILAFLYFSVPMPLWRRRLWRAGR